MEQKDFILREIEKIGIVLRAILNKLITHSHLSFNETQQYHEVKERLELDINFDINRFLLLDKDESIKYIRKINGFSVENIELLADCFYQMGLKSTPINAKLYYEKAILLLQQANYESKTFSLERETLINEIKNILR